MDDVGDDEIIQSTHRYRTLRYCSILYYIIVFIYSLPPLADTLHQADLPGDAPLDQQGVAGPGAAVALLQHLLHGGLALVKVRGHGGLLGAEINDHGVRGEALANVLIAEFAPAQTVDQEHNEDHDEDEENGHQDGQNEQHPVLVFI